jgi:hypothetical protein
MDPIRMGKNRLRELNITTVNLTSTTTDNYFLDNAFVDAATDQSDADFIAQKFPGQSCEQRWDWISSAGYSVGWNYFPMYMRYLTQDWQ